MMVDNLVIRPYFFLLGWFTPKFIIIKPLNSETISELSVLSVYSQKKDGTTNSPRNGNPPGLFWTLKFNFRKILYKKNLSTKLDVLGT